MASIAAALAAGLSAPTGAEAHPSAGLARTFAHSEIAYEESQMPKQNDGSFFVHIDLVGAEKKHVRRVYATAFERKKGKHWTQVRKWVAEVGPKGVLSMYSFPARKCKAGDGC